MPLYLLGVSRSRDATCLRGVPARWVVDGDLAGAVAGPQRSPPDPAEHARSLAAIHQQISVLPMRFGVALKDEAAVRTLLAARREEWASALDRLEGTCEMGVRIWLPEVPRPHFRAVTLAASPAEYLASRRAQYAWEDESSRRAESSRSSYVEALAELSRDWRHLTPAPWGLLRLAFLVDRPRLGAFHARLGTVRRARRSERCATVGPWPPYSFV